MGGVATAAVATLIAAIIPLLTDAEADTKLATAAINLCIGATIGSLLSGVGRSAVRVRRAGDPLAGS
jgi:hypothetical protein